MCVLGHQFLVGTDNTSVHPGVHEWKYNGLIGKKSYFFHYMIQLINTTYKLRHENHLLDKSGQNTT